VVDAEDPSAGPEAVSALRRSHPELKLILLCETLSPAVVHSVVLDSVEGVVMKSDGPQEVILALRHVLEGRAVMPAGWYQAALGTGTVTRSLSEREREVLELAAAGMSNAEIAEKLVVSTNTVKYHLREIYSSLGVHNRVQASQLLNPYLNTQLDAEASGAEDDAGIGGDFSDADG
jgi:DNA-binding NarL/FixJ family response regulator